LNIVEHGLGHGLGVVAGLGHVHQAEPVGLELVLAAIALHPGGRADVGELGHRGEPVSDRGADGQRPLARMLLPCRFCGALRDVGDLVAEHRGELGLGVQVADSRPRWT
jgi:hypothetical protein